MYLRKEVKDFIAKMPKELKKPKHWRKFVNENSKRYNLIIKHGNEYECTNCGKYFYINEKDTFRFNARVFQKEFCPFCNNQYVIRNGNLKFFCFKFDLACIDNVDNKIIIRYFEIYRTYNYKTRKFKNIISEYARSVPELDVELANNRLGRFMYWQYVHHYLKIKRWRIIGGHYGLDQKYDRIYLDDIKEKVKGTIYEYAPLKEAIEYLDNNCVDLKKLLKHAKNGSFELLMKCGLFKLAIDCPEKFEQKGNFEQRFGVTKDFYHFMKKYDINYNELQVLRLIKRKNISVIRGLLKISMEDIDDLVNISKYINLNKFYEYSKKQKRCFASNYLDYIDNMKKIGVPLTKKILMPEDFILAHDESVKKVEIIENKKTDENIRQRCVELEKNIYTNQKFIIRPAGSLNDMKDEAIQQDNCVYRNYCDKYANGETDIYFMRSLRHPEKSLVTVEVKNNKIRQKYQRKNKDVTSEQKAFLNLWEKNVIQKVA